MVRKILSVYLCLNLLMLGFAPIGTAVAQENETYTLAIPNLSGQGTSEVEAAVLSDILRSHITQLVSSEEYKSLEGKDSYEVIEREDMDKIFEQFDLQSTGCVSDSCMIEFGKMLQADRLLLGTIGRIGRSNTLSARIIDIESSKSITTAHIQRSGAIENVMNEMIEEVSSELFIGKKKSKKLWYIIGGVVLAGAGAGAAMMGGGGGGEGTTPPADLPMPPSRP